MVSEFKTKHPLSIEERIKIKQAIDLNMSYREMAEHVGRCKSVVMRESKRLGHFKNYDPAKAQVNFESKQKLAGIRKGSALYLKIREDEKLDHV